MLCIVSSFSFFDLSLTARTALPVTATYRYTLYLTLYFSTFGLFSHHSFVRSLLALPYSCPFALLPLLSLLFQFFHTLVPCPSSVAFYTGTPYPTFWTGWLAVVFDFVLGVGDKVVARRCGNGKLVTTVVLDIVFVSLYPDKAYLMLAVYP